MDARGAYFVGAGDLSIKAKKKILFGVDILNHEVNEKSNALNVSTPGMGAWNAYKQGGNAWDIVTSEDATLAKINSLYGSNNAEEVLANSSNLGIDLCNTTNSVMRGLGEGGLSSELMARYGLGGATGFSPSLTLSMTQSKTKSTFQTQSQGGVDRGGNVLLEAGESVVLENGVRVHAGGNLEVDAPVLIAQAAELKSSTTQTVISESIGIAPLSGQAQSVGASYSKTQSESTTYKNAELSAGGNMSLHYQDKAMQRVELDGANISSKTLDMNTDILIIRDKQDISQTKSVSFSANSSGQFSVYEGKGHEKVTNQSSGIDVVDGINTDGHKVHAGETYMEGGKIITNGENHFETDKLVSQSLKDEKIFNGIGISGNINDLNRWTGQTPANIAGEQAITTATLTVDHVDYKATQQSVLYGSQSTDLEIKETLGDAIHTTSSDSKIIQKDDAMHLHVDIPITNEDYLKACAENIKAGGAKLADLLMPKQEHQDPVDFAKAELLITEDERKKRKSSEETGNNAANDPDIYPESMQDMVDDALQHLHFDSPDKARKFKQEIDVARQEEKSTGKISNETRKKLKECITDALIDTLKTGSEAKWEKLTGKMGSEYSNSLRKLLSNPETFSQAGIKTYIGSKSLLFTFVINLASVSMDSDVLKKDLIKKAASNTASDVSFGLILSLTTGEAAGPIGWFLIPFKVIDNYYDQAQVDRLAQQGVSNLFDAQALYRSGHPMDAWGLERAAADQMGVAARAQAGHDLALIVRSIENHLAPVWDRIFRINSQTNSQTFFKPNQDQIEVEKKSSFKLNP